MRKYSTIVLMVVVFAAYASPAAAGLIISFSATPSVIGVGQTSTIELVLTPILSDPEDRIGLGQLSFESGDGQTVAFATGGDLLAPLTLQHTFTYLSAGTFTATTRGNLSEQHRDASGIIVVSDYFFDIAPLTTNVTVVGVPAPNPIALCGFSALGLLLGRRRRHNIAGRPIARKCVIVD